MPVITGDTTKYNCIKPHVPSVPEQGHRETEQTPKNAASDQELHSFSTGNYIRNCFIAGEFTLKCPNIHKVICF